MRAMRILVGSGTVRSFWAFASVDRQEHGIEIDQPQTHSIGRLTSILDNTKEFAQATVNEPTHLNQLPSLSGLGSVMH
jgi:hypothetical protein